MLASLLLAAIFVQAEFPKDVFQPDPRWRPLGKAIWFDPQERKLILRARVVLREGYLEHLLCLEQTKEHESILATEAPARAIHTGLLLTGAEVGHSVRFVPRFEPPAGTPIRIDLEWVDPDGKPRTALARDWIQDEKSGKNLAVDWVFAGSQLFEDEQTKRTIYAADGGDLITVANFMSAILDLPLASSASDAERSWVAHTERIPPRNTYVTLILRPIRKPDAKSSSSPASAPSGG